ncbi:MAG: hypothetical protein M3024_12505 [Candidatus Dormibacteraeota bacterium]|nr:hypothetical protein [Candidatus Dormibacteraeota bacterium]
MPDPNSDPERADRRPLSPEDALAVAADRRRRIVAAFRLGSEARPERPGLRFGRGLAAGVALALAAALIVGVAGVVRGSLAAAGTPAPRATSQPSPVSR